MIFVFLGVLCALHVKQKAPPHPPLHPAHEAQPHPLFHQLQRDCTQVEEDISWTVTCCTLFQHALTVFSSSDFTCWCSSLVEFRLLSSPPDSLLVRGRRRWRNLNKERSNCECLCAYMWYLYTCLQTVVCQHLLWCSCGLKPSHITLYFLAWRRNLKSV